MISYFAKKYYKWPPPKSEASIIDLMTNPLKKRFMGFYKKIPINWFLILYNTHRDIFIIKTSPHKYHNLLHNIFWTVYQRIFSIIKKLYNAPIHPDAFPKRHLSSAGSFIASADLMIKNSWRLWRISSINTSWAEIPPPMQNFSTSNMDWI